MDPLSDHITRTSSLASSIATDDAESPAHNPASPKESTGRLTHDVLPDGSFEEPATDAVREPSQPMPSEYDTKDDSDALLSSPPPVHVEPAIPDPFIVDDGDDDSEDEVGSSDERMAASTTESSAAADDEIALAQSTIFEPDPATPTQPTYPASIAPATSPYPQPALFSPQPNLLNVHKEMPAVPSAASSEEEDEEPPELYLPGLVLPTMFLPIPNVRFHTLSFVPGRAFTIMFPDGVRPTLSRRC